jgi:uncharacterized RDD family membrane protein YckC
VSRRSRIASALLAWPRGLRGLGRRSGVNRQVGRAVDRGVDRALESESVERIAVRVLDSELVDRLWRRVLASDETQQLVERVADAPEVRRAITRQGVGLVEDLGRGLRRTGRRLDGVAEGAARRLLRRPLRDVRPIYAGVVTRALALAIDAVAVNGVLLLISAAIALVVSGLTSGNQSASGGAIALGAGAWVAIACAYLALFWALTGRTPGMAFLGLRVLSLEGEYLTARQAMRRVVGFAVSALCLMLGFLSVLVEERRRGWHDRSAGSVVLYADPELDMDRGSGADPGRVAD